jgi:putative copper export protein
VALLFGATHQFLVLPHLERVGNRLARSLLAESAVAMAVLLVAAVLVDSKPPPRPVPITSTHARSLAP